MNRFLRLATVSALVLPLTSMSVSAQNLYVRADAVGAFITSEFTDPNNAANMFDFDANGAGIGVRGGILYNKFFIPMFKTGTEFRLSYAPAEDTDGSATFSSGLYGGIFQRFQLDLPGKVTPYFATGTAGAVTKEEIMQSVGSYSGSSFSLKPAVAVGVEYGLAGNLVMGIDASYTQDAPKQIRASLGFNF